MIKAGVMRWYGDGFAVTKIDLVDEPREGDVLPEDAFTDDLGVYIEEASNLESRIIYFERRDGKVHREEIFGVVELDGSLLNAQGYLAMKAFEHVDRLWLYDDFSPGEDYLWDEFKVE